MRYEELKAQPKGTFSSSYIGPKSFFFSPHFDIHSVYSNKLT